MLMSTRWVLNVLTIPHMSRHGAQKQSQTGPHILSWSEMMMGCILPSDLSICGSPLLKNDVFPIFLYFLVTFYINLIT